MTKNPNANKINYGIDLTKFLCALLIVYAHSYMYSSSIFALWFKDTFATIGVPFFFITSGYFFKIGLSRENNSKKYLKRYVMRLVKMYIAWTIITLPVSWLCIEWGHPDYSITKKIIYLMRMILFSGSCGIYWYILALFECAIIIFYCTIRNKKSLLYIVSVLLFLIGILYKTSLSNENFLFRTIHCVFGSENNFLNTGLFYTCIGYFIADNPHKKNNSFYLFGLITILVLIKTGIWKFGLIDIITPVIATTMFLWAETINIDIGNEKSLTLRKLSTAIYLLHFPFLLVIDYHHFHRGTIIGFVFALAFSIVVFYTLKAFLSKEKMKLLFG